MIQIDPDCKNCNKTGLAILPVRYAVVPKTVNAKLPAALKAPHIKPVQMQHHQYALRTLRQGFIYVLYEKRWNDAPLADWYGNLTRAYEVYSVDEQGLLWRQPHPMAVRPVVEPVCKNDSHYVPAALIAIANPEKAGAVWVAFTEHKWSPETLLELGANAKARAQRMQKLDPAALIDKIDHDDGFEATAQSLQEIVEYKGAEPGAIQPGPSNSLSKPDGSYDPALLKSVTTAYPVKMRYPQTAKDTLEHMKVIGQRAGKPPCTPMVLALWDAVGITHELNGFRNEPAGRIEQYGKERELEITALNAIEGLKKALEEKAGEAADFRIKHMQSAPHDMDLDNRATRAHLIYKDDPAKRQAELQAIEQERARRAAARQKGAEKFKSDQIAGAWPKYETKLDGSHKTFKQKYDSFLSAASGIIDNRTDDLLAWLEAQAFIEELTEYHPKSLADGVAFEDKVGKAVFGINSSAKGAQKLDEWIKEVKATRKNLLWRAIALNQEEGIAALNEALAQAQEYQTQRILASTLNAANYVNKSLKALADTYKKATGIYNANTSAGSANGSKAFGVKLQPTSNLFQADYWAMTAGDRIFKHFRVEGLGEHASEKIIQHVFSLRAFIEPADSVNLIQAQAKNAELARSQILQRLRTARTFLASDTEPIKTAQTEALSSAWEKFKREDKGAANAIKDARLALVVMLIEGLNFSKLMGDCALKNDAKSWFGLAASGISISSALFDIASVPAKNLFGAESWSYQKLKLFGGVLSTAATVVGVIIDGKDAIKYLGKEQYGLLALYSLKGVFGALNAGLTVATTFSYAAPLIGRLTGSAALGTAVRGVGIAAARVIGMRILCMSLGGWLTVGSFGIQVFIWFITDDELQDWCSLCVFGIKRSASDAYKTAKEQGDALMEACKTVGV